MAKNGIVSVGVNLDYEKTLNDMVKAFSNKLSQIQNDVNKIEFSKSITDQIEKLRSELELTQKEMNETFKQIGQDKLDISSFENFQKNVEKKFGSIEKEIASLSDSLSTLGEKFNLLGGTDVASGIVTQFHDLKNSISEAYDTLKQVLDLCNTSSTGLNFANIDVNKIKQYKTTLSQISKAQKEIGNISFSSLSDDELFDEMTKQEELLQKQIKSYNELNAEKQKINISDSNYDIVENQLVRVQMAAQKTAEIIDVLDGEIADRELGAGMEDSTANIISSMSRFDGEIDDFVGKARQYIESSEQIQNSTSQTATVFNTFQIKNGTIHVPIELATKDSTLKNSLKNALEKLQSYANENPIIANVELQLDDSISESEKIVRDSIGKIQNIFKENPIAITVDKEKFAKDLEDTIDKSLLGITEGSNVDITKTVTDLSAAIKEFKTELSTNEKLTFGMDEQSINRITAAIENMANMIQRAFGVASDTDITNQWAIVENKFKTIADENGKINLTKSKKDVQELLSLYQDYVSMGGKNQLSELTENVKTVDKLNKKWEEVKNTIQEVTQENQESNTNFSKDVKLEPNIDEFKSEADKLLEGVDLEKEVKLTSVSSGNETTTSSENETHDVENDLEQTQHLVDAKKKLADINANVDQSAIATDSSIESEGTSAKTAAEQMAELAANKKAVVEANEKLAQTALDTAGNLGKEQQASKETADAIGEISEARIDENTNEWELAAQAAMSYRDILGDVVDVVAQMRRAPGKNEEGKELLSYRVTGETGNTMTFNPKGEVLNYNKKIIETLTEQKRAEKDLTDSQVKSYQEDLKREAQYQKDREKYLNQGFQQETKYYENLKKQEEEYVKWWESSLSKQEQIQQKQVQKESVKAVSEKEKADHDYWQGRFQDSVSNLTAKNPILDDMGKYYQEMAKEAENAAKAQEKIDKQAAEEAEKAAQQQIESQHKIAQAKSQAKQETNAENREKVSNDLLQQQLSLYESIYQKNVDIAKLDPNSENYSDSLSLLQSQKKELQEQYVEVNRQLHGYDDIIDRQKQSNELAKIAKEANAEIAKYQTYQDKASSDISSIRGRIKGSGLDAEDAKLQEVINKINTLESGIGSIGDKADYSAFNEQLETVNGELTKLINNEKKATELAASKLKTRITEFLKKNTAITPEMQDTLEAYVAKLEELGLSKGDLVEIATGFERIKSEANAAGKGGLTFFDQWKKRIKSLALTLTTFTSFYDIINKIRQGVEVFKEYDAALTTISYTMDISQSKLNQLGDSVVQLANDMKTSVSDAMSVAQIYANMQTTPEEIVELATPTIVLSNLTGMDASTTSDQIQAVVQQFGVLEEESMHIADVYDYISSQIAVDYSKGVEAISEGVEVAGQSAAAAGLSFEQLSSIIATTVEKTRQEGSAVGNAMKTIMVRLSKASNLDDTIDNETLSDASAALHNVGVEVYNADGSFREFDVIMGELAERFDDLSDAEQANISFAIAA